MNFIALPDTQVAESGIVGRSSAVQERVWSACSMARGSNARHRAPGSVSRCVMESNDLEIYSYNEHRRVKGREGKPQMFARAIRATIFTPLDASASTVLAGVVRMVWQL